MHRCITPVFNKPINNNMKRNYQYTINPSVYRFMRNRDEYHANQNYALKAIAMLLMTGATLLWIIAHQIW